MNFSCDLIIHFTPTFLRNSHRLFGSRAEKSGWKVGVNPGEKKNIPTLAKNVIFFCKNRLNSASYVDFHYFCAAGENFFFYKKPFFWKKKCPKFIHVLLRFTPTFHTDFFEMWFNSSFHTDFSTDFTPTFRKVGVNQIRTN